MDTDSTRFSDLIEEVYQMWRDFNSDVHTDRSYTEKMHNLVYKAALEAGKFTSVEESHGLAHDLKLAWTYVEEVAGMQSEVQS